jgi:hypothetical protein
MAKTRFQTLGFVSCLISDYSLVWILFCTFADFSEIRNNKCPTFWHTEPENFESVINSVKEIVDILDVDPVLSKIRKKKKGNHVWLWGDDEQIGK